MSAHIRRTQSSGGHALLRLFRMPYEPHHFRRTLVLVLAASWCATAAHAGRELPVNASPAPTFRAQVATRPLAMPSAPLLAAADVSAALPTGASLFPGNMGLLAQADAPDLAPPSSAQPAPAPRPSASLSVTVNLINKLVERGVLPKEDATDLLEAAEAETAELRANIAAAHQAAVHAAVTQAVATVQAGGAGVAPEPPLPDSDDAVRVTYIPETVKAQIRDELRAEVMDKARSENWAAPRLFPDWVSRMKLFGDIRVRYEGIFFPEGNDNTGAFPNFNAINTGAPFDVAGTVFPSALNVDQDRHRARLRARLGLEADLSNGFTAGLRIATGENNSPVSTNQSFGLANQGQGGNFSKYSIWLDRGFLKWETGPRPDRHVALSLGRFDNPFFSTDIVWDDDVGFDGFALAARYEVVSGFTPFFAGGAFPVFNTDLNFATNQPAKFESTDKWLYGSQLGADWKIHKDFNLKLAAAYYHFDNVEGQLSDPFIPLSASDQGNTDNTRPSFAQKGNTYRPLRRIIASPLNNFGTTQQFQYFGLATPFQELALTARLDINRWEPFQLTVSGEWVKNLAFDANEIGAIAVNNRGASRTAGGIGEFDGGDTAWIINVRAGRAALQKLGDWQVGVNYRYVESDAVVDGFTDSDFGLGGTNLKGFTLYGALALGPRTSFGLRWMSADEVAGPPLSVDIIQVDFSGKF